MKSHIRKKISEGKKSYAALRLLDDKIDRCFLNSTVEESSMELFKKLVKSIQLFYNMELKICLLALRDVTKFIQNVLKKQPKLMS